MTDAQKLVLQILEDCGGWVCYEAISQRGGSAASARALERDGLVESRYTEGVNGFPFIEWRLTKPKDSK